MSVVRKREAVNEHVNELHERKTLKEEQQRLEKLQTMKIAKKRPKGGRFVVDCESFGGSFADLELRMAAQFAM